MIIRRDYYLGKLIRKKNNGLVKIITGMRRSGKSFLLFNLFKTHLLESGIEKNHIIEVAFDDYANKELRNPDAFYPMVKEQLSDIKNYYLLLDEVQLLGDFEAVLNGLLRISNLDIYVTGSNANFLSKDIITEFRGRGDEIHIFPFSFSELMQVRKDRSAAFREYCTFGGLPPVVLLDSKDDKRSLLGSLYLETYVQDIINRNSIRNDDELKDLISILSSEIGSLANPQRIADTFKSVNHANISPNTISKYIGFLEDSFIISEAQRYDVKGRKYIGTPKKYYFTDMGIRNHIINYRQDEPTHIMENVIYNEILARGYNPDVGVVEIQKREDNGKPSRSQLEIDFICNKASERIYIQSAWMIPDKQKLEQETRPLRMSGDSFKKIILVQNGQDPWYTEDGILVMDVIDFLMDSKALD
ncbi:MAG: ATP-binding protein [Sphaerochaetaceae bacterium]|jgi:predicted AAA+ superfamily ATPase|nr:ATP-binding protein [Sphaerochaetaceae bacterium]